MSNCRDETTGRIVLRKMATKDLDAASDLAILANPFADKERYKKFLVSQLEEYPDLTFVAAVSAGDSVTGYITADLEGDEACIEDIAVTESWQEKGVGKLLLAHIIELLEKRHIRLVKVEVHHKCSSAIPFYHSFGFRFANLALDRFGGEEDATILTKNLKGESSSSQPKN